MKMSEFKILDNGNLNFIVDTDRERISYYIHPNMFIAFIQNTISFVIENENTLEKLESFAYRVDYMGIKK